MSKPSPPPRPLGALLKQIRQLLRDPLEQQERFDRLVALIAEHFEAAVASLYALRPGELLELTATFGLKPEAAHVTRLRLREGLVGTVAAERQPLVSANVHADPRFAYRPETGEEGLQSLLAVPIIRSALLLGVLVVQHGESRHYDEADVEALETLAMVLGEMAGAAGLAGPQSLLNYSSMSGLRLTGTCLVAGAVEGSAVLLNQQEDSTIPVLAGAPQIEQARLDAALERLDAEWDALLSQASDVGGSAPNPSDELTTLMEAFRLLARQESFHARLYAAVASGLTAEAAIWRTTDEAQKRLARLADPYLRERASDYQELRRRLLAALQGKTASRLPQIPAGSILIAQSLGPAELLEMASQQRPAGLVLEEGGPTAHVTIAAAALGIPTLGQVKDASQRIAVGEPLILDADNGQLVVRPSSSVREAFQASLETRRQLSAMQVDPKLPAQTLDGRLIQLSMNAGLLLDMVHFAASGADSLGLFRTEIPFMLRATFPSVAEQTRIYAQVLRAAKGKAVTFRTLDVGGDKILPYLGGQSQERNPAMGWRASRIVLDRPAILRQQIGAMLRAGQDQQVRIMFPLVATAAEFIALKRIAQLEATRLAAKGIKPQQLAFGVMLEVPAMIWQLDLLAGEADFLALGSNDLLQFLFAADREQGAVTRRYGLLTPATLRVLHDLVQRCDMYGLPLSVCGESAGQPLEALALVGSGIDQLSMNAAAIPTIKGLLRSVKQAELSEFIASLRQSRAPSIKAPLRAWALERGLAV